MVQQTWQAWDDSDGGVIFAPASSYTKLLRDGLLRKDATLLHTIEACTGEEAMTLHYQQMGFGTYKPTGDPHPCPNGCGEDYYPEGYGDCPNCGHIG